MNASIVRWKKTHTIILALSTVGALVVFLLWQTVLHTVAQGTPSCSANYLLNVPGAANGSTVSGIGQVQFGAPVLSGGVAATKVDLYSTSAGFLGTAVKQTSGANVSYWSLTLFTQLLPNAKHYIYANVSLSDGSSCNTDTQSTNIVTANPPGSILKATAIPISFSGPPNTVAYIDTDISVNGISVLPFTNVNWVTNVGTVQSVAGVSGRARLFTGPQVMNGLVRATVMYGGRSQTIAVPISVGAAGTPITTTVAPTSPTTVSTNTLSTAAAQQAAASAQTLGGAGTAQAQNIVISASIQDCAVVALGATRAAEIKAGTSRPTAAELVKLKPCLAQTNNVIPSNYAPVAPTKVNELTKSVSTTIVDLSNIKTSENKDALKISGKTSLNSQVLVYVFSEPLVITTNSDAQGNWSYTLEDPLAPGKHEVYAVVDKGDGQYQKTDPFSFVIGTASASAENPSGLSLKLENDPTPIQNNRSIYIYLAVFGVLIACGLLFTFLLFRRWNRHNHLPPPSANITYTPPTPPNYGIS
jgi:hypothetical protein